MDDAEFHRWYGAWSLVRPDEVAELLDGFAGPWWVAGGWAIEAFTGATRRHEDIDVSIFRRDAAALRAAVGDRLTTWSAFEGALRPYSDEHPEVHPDASQLWLRPDGDSPWVVDLLLTPDRDGDWVNRRHPEMALPLDEVTWERAGVRYLSPEVVLLFKARHARPKDERDLAVSLPLLSRAQRAWLRDAIAVVHHGHAWLARLGD